MDISQNNGASAPPAEEQVRRAEEAAAGGNPVDGNPSAGNLAPQAQTQAAQNTAQGDNATPLKTGLRQRGNVESQRAAEAKAARDAAPATFHRERRQELLRDAQELIECLGSGMDLLSIEQIGQIKEAAAEAGSEPREALRSFGERLRDLRNENPHASEADLKEAVRGAVQAIIAKARGQRRRADTQRVAAGSDTPRDVARLPETRRMTRQDVPGPPSGRMLRGAESEVEQMHNYISRIGCNLHEAIRSRDADLITSYRRALHSGIARAHETTNREAGPRGWDPAAVDGMLQEVEESTATLLPEAEQVLLELEEEARANWEERAVYHATQVTNLAGEAFQTLSENRWSRRDCTEYQEELDWAMRIFRRVYDEVDVASMPVKMRRMASRQARPSQPRVPAGHKGRGETPAGTRRTPGGEVSAGRWWSPRGAEVSGRLRRRACPRPEDGVRGLHPHGEVADFAGDGDPGRRAVLGECTDTGKVGSPQRSRQRPRNRRPRHGWTEHRRTRTPPEGRQGTSASWGQHPHRAEAQGSFPARTPALQQGWTTGGSSS
jgi:hypothetical protein